jgi:hypothetical protein
MADDDKGARGIAGEGASSRGINPVRSAPDAAKPGYRERVSSLLAGGFALTSFNFRDGRQSAVDGWETPTFVVHGEILNTPATPYGAAVVLVGEGELIGGDVLAVAYLTPTAPVLPLFLIAGLAYRNYKVLLLTNGQAQVRLYVSELPNWEGPALVVDERGRSWVGAFAAQPASVAALGTSAQLVERILPGALASPSTGRYAQAPAAGDIVPPLVGVGGGLAVSQGPGARPQPMYRSTARENHTPVLAANPGPGEYGLSVLCQVSSQAASALYLLVYDSSTLPAANAVPDFPPIEIQPGDIRGLVADVSSAIPIVNGLVAVLSTSDAAYVAPASALGWFLVQYQI